MKCAKPPPRGDRAWPGCRRECRARKLASTAAKGRCVPMTRSNSMRCAAGRRQRSSVSTTCTKLKCAQPQGRPRSAQARPTSARSAEDQGLVRGSRHPPRSASRRMRSSTDRAMRGLSAAAGIADLAPRPRSTLLGPCEPWIDRHVVHVMEASSKVTFSSVRSRRSRANASSVRGPRSARGTEARRELVGVPARAHAQHEATAAQEVEGGQLLGEHDGLAQRQHEHGRAPRGSCACTPPVREHAQWREEGHVVDERRPQEMLGHPEAVEPSDSARVAEIAQAPASSGPGRRVT
jgi:hypothetical protein